MLLDRQPDLAGDVGAVRSRISGSRSTPSTRDRRDPAQVIEADVVERQAIRVDAQVARAKRRWKRDRHVAEAERAMALIEQRLGDDADRVREVDDPGVRRRPLADQLGQLHHDGHGAQRLGEAARAGRLLADGAELEGQRLVERRAAWPPTRSWISTKSAPSTAAAASSVRVRRPGQSTRCSMRWASPPTTSQPVRCRCRGARARRSAGGRGGWSSPSISSGV